MHRYKLQFLNFLYFLHFLSFRYFFSTNSAG